MDIKFVLRATLLQNSGSLKKRVPDSFGTDELSHRGTFLLGHPAKYRTSVWKGRLSDRLA